MNQSSVSWKIPMKGLADTAGSGVHGPVRTQSCPSSGTMLFCSPPGERVILETPGESSLSGMAFRSH